MSRAFGKATFVRRHWRHRISSFCMPSIRRMGINHYEKRERDMKPNILLITVEQMRFDCLHYLNHPVVQTPNLDHLAAKGATFTSAYSATPSCVPARASIITGMSQRNHGRVGCQDKVPWTYEHTLLGELARAGYHTQCIAKMHVYPTRNLCGFHHIELHDGYMHYNRDRASSSALEWWDNTDDYLPWLRERTGHEQGIMDNGLDCNASVVARPWHLDEKYHPTNWTVTRSIDFLRRRDPGCGPPSFVRTRRLIRRRRSTTCTKTLSCRSLQSEIGRKKNPRIKPASIRLPEGNRPKPYAARRFDRLLCVNYAYRPPNRQTA